MKKIWLFLGIAVIFGAAAWFFAAGYDYKKIVFVLPSSETVSYTHLTLPTNREV